MSLPDLRTLTVFDQSLREVPINPDGLVSAIGEAQEKLEIAEANESLHDVIRLLGYLGNACRIAGSLGESIRYLERAVLLSQNIKDRKAELVNTIRLAEARKYNTEHAVAENLLRSALKFTDENGLSTHKDFVLHHLGKCRLEQRAVDDATSVLQEALKLRTVKGDSELIKSTELALQMARTPKL